MILPRLVRLNSALALLPLLLSGCGGLLGGQPPLEFYTLSATSGMNGQPVVGGARPASSGPIFAVAAVRVPQYLSQRSIVVRSSPTQLDLADNDVWAAPLSDTISSVLSENISTMIPSDRVVELPVSAAVPVDYELRVEIVRFERQPDGGVDLVARWSVFSEGGERLVAVERSSYRVPDVSPDFRSITLAMSALLGELSRDIADTLRNVSNVYQPSTDQPRS